MEDELKKVIDDLILKAEERIAAGWVMEEKGFYEDAASRAYYAMFYATSTLLWTKGLGSSKHSGIISMFNQYFVKEGLIEKEYGKMLIKGYELREMADYKMYSITKENAEIALKRAEEFVGRVKVYLDGFFGSIMV